MNIRWIPLIAVFLMLGCTEPTPAPPAKATAERKEHFASDLERGLDQAKALENQLEQLNQDRINGHGD